MRRLVIAAISAALLGVVPLTGIAAWSSNCSSSGGKVCIYADDNWVLPVAAMNGSKADYADGAKYPNSNTLINDCAFR